MNTIAHHTCTWEGGKATVLEKAPFIAVHDPEKKKYQFLGTGYYFWDYNKEYAVTWGASHYNVPFFVIEYELLVDDKEVLDLVGNRRHMKWLRNTRIDLQRQGHYIDEDWGMGTFIEYLKKLRVEEADEAIFPFIAIKAVDTSARTDEQYLAKFVENKGVHTNLNPRIVICLTKKNEVRLPKKKLVYESARGR